LHIGARLRRQFRSSTYTSIQANYGIPFHIDRPTIKSRHLLSGDYLDNRPNERRGLSLSIRQTPSQYS